MDRESGNCNQQIMDAAFIQSLVVAATGGSPNPAVMNFQHPHPIPIDPTTLTQPNSSVLADAEAKDSTAARKLQKADREKLRRDRLNEHFLQLGKAIDPDRPKNDKGTILSDTIQLLKDLTSKVNKLKAEHTSLSEECHEMTQEKRDLEEEKSLVKSDIDNLNIQYQQRLQSFTPCAPPAYPFPMPPPGSIAMHPSAQPYPFMQTSIMYQIPGPIQNPCSSFVPCMAPNVLMEQQSTQRMSPIAQPSSRSDSSFKQGSQNKSVAHSKTKKSGNSNDVTTNLELKTSGSSAEQDASSGRRKSLDCMEMENVCLEDCYSSGWSPSHSAQDSSPNSVVA